MFIVNAGEHRQAVDIELCMNEGMECTNQEDAPSGQTACRQKYTAYKLYAVTESGHQVFDSFALPSACLCHHRTDFAYNRHFGSQAMEDPLSNLKCSLAEKLDLGKSQQTQDVENLNMPQLMPEHTSCKGNYCEDVLDYPASLVEKALENHGAQLSQQLFKQLFHPQCQRRRQGQRFATGEQQLCYSQTKTVFPKIARDTDQRWRLVVNVANFTQAVEDFGSCLYSSSGGNQPGLTSCKQDHREHRLLSFTKQGLLEVAAFKLPSACACYIRQSLFSKVQSVL